MTRRCRRLLGIFLAALLLLLIGVGSYPWFTPDMESRVLDAEARAAMPGRDFVTLSAGVTHYEWAGPEDGQMVVLIHGFTSPGFIWDSQFQTLAEAGFRVLRYDLYGRGLSDRPRVRYTADLFDRQLLDLLDALDARQPVDLVGMSMGGAVVAHFIDRHPDRVRRFGLISPSGFMVDVPLKYRMLKAPLIGDWIMRAFGDKTTLAGLPRQVKSDPTKSEGFVRKYKEQMRFKGHRYALLSTLRHNPVLELDDVYRRVGERGHAGILFWGTKDHVVPFEHHLLVEAAIPSIAFHALEDGGHIENYEHPDMVNPALIAFLQR